MGWMGKALAALAGWALAGAAVAQTPQQVKFLTELPSAAVRQVAQWALETGDAGERHFLVVDKKDARLYLFEPAGRLLAVTPVLLGATVGDETAPGVGLRAQTLDVGPEERTTPAGRFVTTPGRNLKGEHVVWLDYASAFAIHRLRPGKGEHERARRLASPRPDDNRVSLGCVVVPAAFYKAVVQPRLSRKRGVVYVLPETQQAAEFFGAM